MTDASFTIRRGDTAPAIQATLLDGAGNPVNLTGATVRLHVGRSGQPIVDAPATIVDAAGGVVSYAWQAQDLATPGQWLAEWEVTYATGEVETFPNASQLLVTVLHDLA